jgi:hypothetical protein
VVARAFLRRGRARRPSRLIHLLLIDGGVLRSQGEHSPVGRGADAICDFKLGVV